MQELLFGLPTQETGGELVHISNHKAATALRLPILATVQMKTMIVTVKQHTQIVTVKQHTHSATVKQHILLVTVQLVMETTVALTAAQRLVVLDIQRFVQHMDVLAMAVLLEPTVLLDNHA